MYKKGDSSKKMKKIVENIHKTYHSHPGSTRTLQLWKVPGLMKWQEEITMQNSKMEKSEPAKCGDARL